jgi:hypothetical protein
VSLLGCVLLKTGAVQVKQVGMHETPLFGMFANWWQLLTTFAVHVGQFRMQETMLSGMSAT